jgi:SSS family solute:Na+ symporter
VTVIDFIVFAIFAASVVTIGLLKSRGEKETAEDYFLAGRGLTWPLIGFSLIAANISAEQMVGMSGAAANSEMGFAIASYEWMAAITLVVVAFTFLPTFLRSGIYTIPQFLDHRYGVTARTVMSLLMFITFVLVNISTVTYLGAKFLDPYVNLGPGGIDIVVLSWGIGLIAAIYIAVGGLKASAWADLIQGSALIVGAGIVTILAIGALASPDVERGMNDAATVARSLGVAETAGVGERLSSVKEEHMHMFLPKTHDAIPWTALVIGMWIPHFYYWGLNQYIVQRTLGSKTLAEGQKGIVFAAALKLIIPFVVVVPGILAFTLYSDQMAEKADVDTNNQILATFESDPGGKVFPFRDDFAQRDFEQALQIFEHNVATVGAVGPDLLAAAESIDGQDGKPREPGEVLAVANDAALAMAPDDTSFERQPLLFGYDYDDAFPVLVQQLVPIGLKGFVIAAVMGAVVSSLASMMNAASTIFTMDLYNRFIDRRASQRRLVWTGRVIVVVSMVIGCIVAPFISNPNLKGAFNFIQEFQGFISPGILTIFLFGLFVKRAPRICGVIGLILSPVIYGGLFLIADNTDFEPGSVANLLIDPFLNRMAITIILISTVLGTITLLRPLKEPIKLPVQEGMEVQESRGAKTAGIVVVIATIALYVIFA